MGGHTLHRPRDSRPPEMADQISSTPHAPGTGHRTRMGPQTLIGTANHRRLAAEKNKSAVCSGGGATSGFFSDRGNRRPPRRRTDRGPAAHHSGRLLRRTRWTRSVGRPPRGRTISVKLIRLHRPPPTTASAGEKLLATRWPSISPKAAPKPPRTGETWWIDAGVQNRCLTNWTGGARPRCGWAGCQGKISQTATFWTHPKQIRPTLDQRSPRGAVVRLGYSRKTHCRRLGLARTGRRDRHQAGPQSGGAARTCATLAAEKLGGPPTPPDGRSIAGLRYGPLDPTSVRPTWSPPPNRHPQHPTQPILPPPQDHAPLSHARKKKETRRGLDPQHITTRRTTSQATGSWRTSNDLQRCGSKTTTRRRRRTTHRHTPVPAAMEGEDLSARPAVRGPLPPPGVPPTTRPARRRCWNVVRGGEKPPTSRALDEGTTPRLAGAVTHLYGPPLRRRGVPTDSCEMRRPPPKKRKPGPALKLGCVAGR